MTRTVVVAVALSICAIGVIAFVVMRRQHRELSAQEDLDLARNPDWIRLDLEDVTIRSAVERARSALSEFTRRVPRYDPAVDKMMDNVRTVDGFETARQRWETARLDPPHGPRFAIRAACEAVLIPSEQRVFTQVWFPHARYDEQEDMFWCLPPANPPAWIRPVAGVAVGIPSKNVVDWRITSGDRVEGDYTTKAIEASLREHQP